MADIIKFYGRNTQIQGNHKSVALEWHKNVTGQRRLRTVLNPRWACVKVIVYDIFCFSIVLQSAIWLRLDLDHLHIWTAIFVSIWGYIIHRIWPNSESDIAFLINSLLDYENWYPERVIPLRRRPFRQQLSILTGYMGILSDSMASTLFVIVLPWFQSRKLSLAGYWIVAKLGNISDSWISAFLVNTLKIGAIGANMIYWADIIHRAVFTILVTQMLTFQLLNKYLHT